MANFFETAGLVTREADDWRRAKQNEDWTQEARGRQRTQWGLEDRRAEWEAQDRPLAREATQLGLEQRRSEVARMREADQFRLDLRGDMERYAKEGRTVAGSYLAAADEAFKRGDVENAVKTYQIGRQLEREGMSDVVIKALGGSSDEELLKIYNATGRDKVKAITSRVVRERDMQGNEIPNGRIVDRVLVGEREDGQKIEISARGMAETLGIMKKEDPIKLSQGEVAIDVGRGRVWQNPKQAEWDVDHDLGIAFRKNGENFEYRNIDLGKAGGGIITPQMKAMDDRVKTATANLARAYGAKLGPDGAFIFEPGTDKFFLDAVRLAGSYVRQGADPEEASNRAFAEVSRSKKIDSITRTDPGASSSKADSILNKYGITPR